MDVDVERLRSHVAALAGSPRPAESRALDVARDYVADQLAGAGWTVERAAFEAVSAEAKRLRGVNLIARRRAQFNEALPRLCVGAHVDSRPETPGADDNASAVAALLELARLLPDTGPAKPRLELELVAFDLEENGMLGGAEHARRMQAQRVDLRGMVSLEMLGYCDHTPGSQRLPPPLVGKYPDVGNFIGLIGNQNSQSLLSAFYNGMVRVAELPVERLLVPDNGNSIAASRLSDHSPFWDAGFAALMITDTSFLRNPHYHLPSDTLETLDMVFLAKVAQGCLQAVRLMLELEQ